MYNTQHTIRELPRLYAYFLCRLLSSLENKTEAALVGSVAVCFVLLLVADYLEASMELGCFLAGLAIGSQGHSIVEQVQYITATTS